jgi:hypothetical protein
MDISFPKLIILNRISYFNVIGLQLTCVGADDLWTEEFPLLGCCAARTEILFLNVDNELQRKSESFNYNGTGA